MADSDTKAFGVVYVITNHVNGKRYVGQTTKTAEWRFNKHCLNSQYKSRVNSAIQKYGRENFSVETFGQAENRKELDALEIHCIRLMQSLNPEFGYNVAPGGVGNNIRTKQAIEKAAAKLRGRKTPLEQVERMAATKRNRPRTPAERAVLDQMIAKNTGAKHSEEAKKKMSTAASGRKMAPCTEEHRKKLSDAAKRQWAAGRGHSPTK